jgi:hypothetical protein
MGLIYTYNTSPKLGETVQFDMASDGSWKASQKNRLTKGRSDSGGAE